MNLTERNSALPYKCFHINVVTRRNGTNLSVPQSAARMVLARALSLDRNQTRQATSTSDQCSAAVVAVPFDYKCNRVFRLRRACIAGSEDSGPSASFR